MDEACVQAEHLENIGQKKGKPSGSKKKEHQEASKEGNNKWKGGKYKKTKNTAQQSKYPNNHYNHCNIDGDIEEKCWKLHLEMNLKKHTKDRKKKNLLDTDSSNQVESSLNVDDNIFFTSV
jgi:hypothetical protein